MTDPVADLLTRIRNASGARHRDLSISASNQKVEIARILKEEGYIADYALAKEGGFPVLKILLKYGPDRKGAITRIYRVSKPGLRKYVGAKDIPSVLNGLGIAILSTSRGVMTDASARAAGVGGELICKVY